jgi:hypothetical protein
MSSSDLSDSEIAHGVVEKKLRRKRAKKPGVGLKDHVSETKKKAVHCFKITAEASNPLCDSTQNNVFSCLIQKKEYSQICVATTSDQLVQHVYVRIGDAKAKESPKDLFNQFKSVYPYGVEVSFVRVRSEGKIINTITKNCVCPSLRGMPNPKINLECRLLTHASRLPNLNQDSLKKILENDVFFSKWSSRRFFDFLVVFLLKVKLFIFY